MKLKYIILLIIININASEDAYNKVLNKIHVNLKSFSYCELENIYKTLEKELKKKKSYESCVTDLKKENIKFKTLLQTIDDLKFELNSKKIAFTAEYVDEIQYIADINTLTDSINNLEKQRDELISSYLKTKNINSKPVAKKDVEKSPVDEMD